MKHKHIPVILAALVVLASVERLAGGQVDAPPENLAAIETSSGAGPGFAGQFLASHFAQSQYDWRTANDFLDGVLEQDPENSDLLKRSMILAMGEGDLPLAAARADTLLVVEEDNSLARLILAVSALSQTEADRALAELARMPTGDVTDFVNPLMKGWALAAKGTLDTSNFNETTIHSYSGALISLLLGDKEAARGFAQKMVDLGALSPFDMERVADIMTAMGEREQALAIYKGLFENDRYNRQAERKIRALEKNDGSEKALIQALQIKTPAQGAAVAMYDLARLLFQEQSDSSAKIFAQMALTLDPQMIDARLLLANALARNGRYSEAIEYFSAVTPDDDNYLEVQHYIADLMVEAGRQEDAFALLNGLFVEYNDVEALIRIGDIHRQSENFGNALKAYNRAASQIGETIPEEYWHLLYARGMVYEREGQWNKAEADLKAALVYRPDNPYLLNYLGYGWADQGINLEQSLELLQRAVSLRPGDSFITDSLGWAYYMLGRFDDAIPQLEKAVALMPYDSTVNDHLGDAYWQVGRTLEARFQWQRAANYSENDDDRVRIESKLQSGIERRSTVREAKSHVESPQN